MAVKLNAVIARLQTITQQAASSNTVLDVLNTTGEEPEVDTSNGKVFILFEDSDYERGRENFGKLYKLLTTQGVAFDVQSNRSLTLSASDYEKLFGNEG